MTNINLAPSKCKSGLSLSGGFFYAGFTCFVIAVALSFYTYGLYRIKTLKQEIKEGQVTYCLLDETVKSKKKLEKFQLAIENKNKIMMEQTKKNLSFYAVMIHLGGLAVDGVALEQTVCQENALTLKGRMKDYSQLAAFMKNCEEDPFFHSVKLVNLKNSERQEFDSDFEIVLELEEETCGRR